MVDVALICQNSRVQLHWRKKTAWEIHANPLYLTGMASRCAKIHVNIMNLRCLFNQIICIWSIEHSWGSFGRHVNKHHVYYIQSKYIHTIIFTCNAHMTYDAIQHITSRPVHPPNATWSIPSPEQTHEIASEFVAARPGFNETLSWDSDIHTSCKKLIYKLVVSTHLKKY